MLDWLLRLFGGKIGFRFTYRFGGPDPGYMSKDKILSRLKTAANEAIKDFEPEKNYQGEITTTYCNKAVEYICHEVWGFKGFTGMLANQMFDRMRGAPDFAVVDAEAAQKLANDARMVIAAQKGDEHGHVAVVVPGKTLYSSNWRGMAPLVANVGRRNGIMGGNFAFHTEPTFFVLIDDKIKEAA